jgi:hypothetical protein
MKTFGEIKSVSISETRWLAYATAGVASALGVSPSAEAEIHYSGIVNIKLTGNAQASLPLSNGASLVFKNIFEGSTFWQDFDFLIQGVISGSARGAYNTTFGRRNFLANLGLGENVSAGNFYSVAGNPGIGVLISNWSDGQFSPVGGPGGGFVGFRFNTGNGTQYGWARIETRNDGKNRLHDAIKDYAWGDPGDVILTGQKHSSESANANSVLGSLGQLAFGAQGLDAWRTQRTQNPTD